MNIERFRAVLNHIKLHPEEWDQESYCGSACCFAGHTVAKFGTPDERKYVLEDDVGFERKFERSYCDIAKSARLLLEINDREACWLFNSYRSLDQFEEVAFQGDVSAAMESFE